MPTPNGRSTIDADLYPFATPRPLTYMKPGQPFYTMRTYGGWYVGKRGLKQMLIDAGVPASVPDGSGTSTWRWMGIAAFALAALAVMTALLMRRRLQTAPSPVS